MKKKYKNIGGVHTTKDGAVIKPGATFTDPDHNLCDTFVNHFQDLGMVADTEPTIQTTDTPVEEKTDVQKAAEAGAADITPDEDEDTSGEDTTTEKDTTDVTDDFTTAKEADLTVTKVDGKWWVYDEDKEEPLNEKGLRKKDVPGFVDEYLAD